MECIWKSNTVALAFYPSLLQLLQEITFTSGVSSWWIIPLKNPVILLKYKLFMPSLWLAELSDDGHMELQDCLALIETPCTLPETATALFQELLSSVSPLDASDLPSILLFSHEACKKSISYFFGLREVSSAAEWAHSLLCDLAQKVHTLKVIHNWHWTPHDVFCIMDNV